MACRPKAITWMTINKLALLAPKPHEKYAYYMQKNTQRLCADVETRGLFTLLLFTLKKYLNALRVPAVLDKLCCQAPLVLL